MTLNKHVTSNDYVGEKEKNFSDVRVNSFLLIAELK